MRTSFIGVALFASLVANAATIDISNSGFIVSASVSRAANGPLKVEDQANLAIDYNLLITGGTGSGVFTPLLILRGSTNESMGLYPLLGGTAMISSPLELQAGDPMLSYSHPNGPLAYCSPLNNCFLPFVFNVPQTLHFLVSVDMVVEANPGNASFGMYSAGDATVEFDGIDAFNSDRMRMMPDDISLIAVPEPYMAAFTGALVLAILIVALRRTSRKSRIC